MLDWLNHQNIGGLIAIAAVCGGLLIPVVAIITSQWARIRRDEMHARQVETEAALKQQMFERGMSADEIVRVLECGQSRPASAEQTRAEKDLALMQQMIDNGMSAEEIVHILQAGQTKAATAERNANELAGHAR